ncbi:hypothetical protein [Lysobacter sp. CA199]|uniref:hypothetical protein n=1 Tax=Lysobacter sp. CA199 TaxID=3455608 RepID=UPI003F8D0F3E
MNSAVIVSGPPGSGKTTVSTALARAEPCGLHIPAYRIATTGASVNTVVRGTQRRLADDALPLDLAHWLAQAGVAAEGRGLRRQSTLARNGCRSHRAGPSPPDAQPTMRHQVPQICGVPA